MLRFVVECGKAFFPNRIWYEFRDGQWCGKSIAEFKPCSRHCDSPNFSPRDSDAVSFDKDITLVRNFGSKFVERRGYFSRIESCNNFARPHNFGRNQRINTIAEQSLFTTSSAKVLNTSLSNDNLSHRLIQ